jgi:hypothetical protein
VNPWVRTAPRAWRTLEGMASASTLARCGAILLALTAACYPSGDITSEVTGDGSTPRDAAFPPPGSGGPFLFSCQLLDPTYSVQCENYYGNAAYSLQFMAGCLASANVSDTPCTATNAIGACTMPDQEPGFYVVAVYYDIGSDASAQESCANRGTFGVYVGGADPGRAPEGGDD